MSTANDDSKDADPKPPEVIREGGMASVMDGREIVGYTWRRDNPNEVFIFIDAASGYQETKVSVGDHIIGPDGEERAVIEHLSVSSITGDPDDWWVDLYVENEEGELIPHNIALFAFTFLGNETNRPDEPYEVDQCKALSPDELERERWKDTVDILESLDEGDKILWGDRSEPLTVTSIGLTFTTKIWIDGPRGGRYTIEWEDGLPTIRRNVNDESVGRPVDLKVVEHCD